MRRTLLIAALLLVGTMVSGAEAQVTLFNGPLKTTRASIPTYASSTSGRQVEADSTSFRVKSTTLYDTSLALSTSGWRTIALQHLFGTGVETWYCLRPQWSNDRSTWTSTTDSVITTNATAGAKFDTLTVRPFQYFRVVVSTVNLTGSTTSGSTVTGTVNLCAKGVK